MRGDGVYKRPGSPYWYYKLKANGRWQEVSTKTKNHQKAMSARREALNAIEEGRLVIGGLGRLAFEVVTTLYLQTAVLALRESTLKKERQFLVRPVRLFGQQRCDQITEADIFKLQTLMKQDNCKNSYVNLVVGATGRVLRFARVWQRIEPNVKRLPERTPPIGRVLKREEKEKLFRVAASNPA